MCRHFIVKLLATIGYLILYVGLLYSAELLDQGGFIASLWYPPAGLTVFGILAFGWAGVALDAAGSALTLILAGEWRGTSLSWVELLSGFLIHSLAYAAVLLPMRRWIGHAELSSLLSPIYRFLLATLLCTVFATSVGIARLIGLGIIDYSNAPSIALTWLTGDIIGIITFTPFLQVVVLPRLHIYINQARSGDNFSQPKMSHSMIVGILLLALAPLFLLSIPWSLGLTQHSPFSILLLLLPLAWIVFQGGLYSAVISVLLLSSGLVLGATLFDYNSHAFEYQLIMITVSLTGLLLSEIVEERNLARKALQNHTLNLEAQVAIKTAALQENYLKAIQSEQHLQILIDTAPAGIAELEMNGRCYYLNPTGCALAALSQEEIQGHFFTEFIHPDDCDRFQNILQLQTVDLNENQLEFRLQKSGRWVAAYWIKLVDTEPPRIILIFVDITERQSKAQLLWYQAHHDILTKLPNRKLFMERLNQGLLRAKRNRQYLGLLWIDLDGFKAINDHLGHAAGDELLRQVAQRLESRMRACDTVARMGGDEFAVILSDIKEQDTAIHIAEELTALLVNPYTLNGSVSASIGVSLYPSHTEDSETLLKYADIAMYAAKNAGKNQTQLWQPSFLSTM